MSRFTKYKLYQKYETRGSQEAIPCYPNVFSIDGDGTMPLVIVEENSRDCGYTGETQPIYRWYTLPIDTYYYCDACQDAQYRWVDIPPDDDWECVGTTKYLKQKKQVSVDGGSTWTDVSPAEYQRGAAFEYNSEDCGYRTRTTTGSPYCEGYDKYVDAYSQYSTDGGNTWQTTATTPTMVEHNSAYCGYIEPQYRTTTGDTYCSGVNKYVPVYSQVSYDGGVTWETTATTQTLVERNSPDCGYEAKFSATYSDGRTYNIDCSGTAHLYSGETHPSGYESSAMTSAKVGNCVDEIRICAFGDMYTMSSITISDSVTGIGETAFSSCSGLTSLTLPSNLRKLTHGAFIHCTKIPSVIIPSGVTEIENNVFEGCTSLSSVTLHNNITSIGGNAFNGCALREINIPDSVTNIGGWAFRNCTNLSSVTLSNNISYIKQMTFDGCTSLKSIVIPDSVIAIGSDGAGADGWAFQGCTSLSSCTIGSGVTNIAFYSFMNCSSLQSIDIPNSVTTIGSAAFAGCTSLTSCTIGSGVTSIADMAFDGCSGLTSIDIPDSTTNIGFGAFGGCSGLTSITVGSGITSIDDMAFMNCVGARTFTFRATTPPELGALGGTGSKSSVFANLTDYIIYVPCDSVQLYKNRWSDAFVNGYVARHIQGYGGQCTGLKYSASYSDGRNYTLACDSNTTLTSGDTRPQGYTYTEMSAVTVFGDCIRTIGDNAFGLSSSAGFWGGFTGLTTAEITEGVTTLGGFHSCSNLQTISMPNSLTIISNSAFAYCSSLTSIEIPSGVTSIGNGAFSSCSSLKRVNSDVDGVFNIPSGVTSIGNGVFAGCSGLTSIDIPSGVTSIEGYTFYGCSNLTSIDISDSTTSIGPAAFMGCNSLSGINALDNVVTIGSHAFSGCSSLTAITIGDRITSIGEGAFDNCSSLTSITVNATTPPTLDIDAFRGTNNCPIYVPVDKVSEYKSASGWSNYSSRIQPNPTTPIKYKGTYSGGGTYYKGCDGNSTLETGDTKPSNYTISDLRIAEISACTTYIGDYAFSGCTSLSSVTIPNSVTSIGYNSFRDCSSLSSVIIPDSVTSISYYAFYNCSSLTSVNIPSGVTYIASYTFQNCTRLANINIPSGVTSIGNYAFSGCTSLPVTNYVRYADTYAVGASVKTKSSYSIKEGTRWIGNSAFENCSGMTSVSIPNSVISIGEHAFDYCTGLTSVNIPSGVTSIGYGAFAWCYSLTNVEIPSGVTYIGSQTFQSCRSITNITIPDSVTTIENFAFNDCRSLISCTIGSGVTRIGQYVFGGCTSLSSITVNAITPPTLGTNVFYNTNDCPIYVPSESVETYKSASGWSDYASRIQAIP